MAETTPPPLTFAVGDRVVYPNQGVCRVTSVESKEVAGQTLTFVTMKREEDGAVVMVPEAKVRAIGLRKVAGRADVDRVFSFLRSDSDKANLDWKQRARTNVERMSLGGLMGLAEVVKGLQVLSELRPLPTKERELYDNARHLLVAELAASLDVAEVDAEDSVDVVLFPPGRERPKRTAEEFRTATGEEEGIELGDDLLGLGGDIDLGAETEPEPEAEAKPEEPAAPAPKGKPAGKPKGEKKAPAEKKHPPAKKAPEKKAPEKKAAKKHPARPEKKPARPEKKHPARPAARAKPAKSAKKK
ncbi:MAG: CarD family transcriptional regulator [Myxococcaceae bacterium]